MRGRHWFACGWNHDERLPQEHLDAPLVVRSKLAQGLPVRAGPTASLLRSHDALPLSGVPEAMTQSERSYFLNAEDWIEWENVPFLGQFDFERVNLRAVEILSALRPEPSTLDNAQRTLEARADSDVC